MNGPFRARDRLTPRQEAFAQHVARGVSMGEAYRLAGFNASGNGVYEGANKLMKKAKVRARADLLQAKAEALRDRAAEATLIVTAQSVSLMLAEAFEDAKRWKQSGAQVSAAMGLAKVHGLLVDKTEDVTRRATRDPDAPLEIDVDHWVNEQVPLLLGAAKASLEPLPVSPEPSPSGADPEGSLDAPRVCGDELPDLPTSTSPQGPSPEGSDNPQGSDMGEDE